MVSGGGLRDALPAHRLRRGGYPLERIAPLIAQVRSAGGVALLESMLRDWRARLSARSRTMLTGACNHMTVTATDDEDATTFVQFEGLPVLTRAAFQLHTFAVMNSIRDGHPGFVSDDYLNAVPSETTTTVLELEAAGMWERREDGYFIVADEMVKAAIDHGRQQDRREAECARHGAHLSGAVDESGSVICSRCGVPLQRPDGGQVAQPHGGRPGPDRRDDEG